MMFVAIAGNGIVLWIVTGKLAKKKGDLKHFAKACIRCIGDSLTSNF